MMMNMEPSELMLDGNAIGGALAALFGREMTDMESVCPACGACHTIGAHHLYRGAGAVLRCPTCDAVVAIIVEAAGHTTLTLRSTWRFRGVARSAL
jgi:hypothetical protein